jgi:hypothetical protein
MKALTRYLIITNGDDIRAVKNLPHLAPNEVAVKVTINAPQPPRIIGEITLDLPHPPPAIVTGEITAYGDE